MYSPISSIYESNTPFSIKYEIITSMAFASVCRLHCVCSGVVCLSRIRCVTGRVNITSLIDERNPHVSLMETTKAIV